MSAGASFASTEIQVGDVFLNITGASIGRSAIADIRVKGGNVNQHVCIIRPKTGELDAGYLNCFLLSTAGQRQIDSFQAGGNRQGLNFGQIRSFRLWSPTVPEQSAIAAVLSDMDAELAALEQRLDKTRALKQGMMQELLTGRTRLV
jgi:type I restriction enzyme S subunit